MLIANRITQVLTDNGGEILLRLYRWSLYCKTWSYIFWTERSIVHMTWIKFLSFLLKELYCFTLIFKNLSFALPYFGQLPYRYLCIIIAFDWSSVRWSRKVISFPTLLYPDVYSFSKCFSFNKYFSETDSYCSVNIYCLFGSIKTVHYQSYWYQTYVLLLR